MARPLDIGSRPVSNELVVVTDGLAKKFGTRTAVDGIDLRIPLGAVSGFVGPNGAGKTTTIRMLLGLISPTAGSGMVLGHPMTHPAAYLSRVGALIEAPAFYPTLSGRANVRVLARLGKVDLSRVNEVLETVGLLERAADLYRSYSLGMKQRLGIAVALLPSPSLLVLDEPANGLDPAGILEVRRLLRALADDGITIFVSSHLLAEVEQICDHLVMIQHGQLVFQGPVAELVAAQGAELEARPERLEDVAALVALVEHAGRDVTVDDGMVRVTADEAWAAELNRIAFGAGITLTHLRERRGSLEEAFFELTGTATGDVPGRLSDVEAAPKQAAPIEAAT
jgi:ABC-2 type transport system ATP-binding protein